ncbi:MAG: hypothetical protein LBU43_04900 [Candidatus Accumulibacter sp.]|nr:hypothetical protein [Accumulibacter sp.]
MNTSSKIRIGPIGPARQSGVVLIIALVVLIAMTLSALSLIRSVNMTNLISGNLAFRESAVLSAERGMEEALVWLRPRALSGLNVDIEDAANKIHYWAKRVDPDPESGQKWDAFYDSLLPRSAPGTTDGSGNTVTYIVHRLCERAGPVKDADPQKEANCSKPPLGSSGSSYSAGGEPLPEYIQVYYRITSRVKGPRNTVVYTQTVLAL